MYTKRFALIALIILLLLDGAPVQLFAAQSQFQIGVDVTGPADTVPPSIPTGLAADPVSDSEIHLIWNPSTDNVSVAGYHIYRSSTLIATTTALDYTDSGLLASTTYSYQVSAFDHAGNESGLSGVVSTTTLSSPVVQSTPPNTGGNQGGSSGQQAQALKISGLATEPDMNDAVLSWSTNLDSSSKVFWGRTADYELGVVSEVAASSDHVVQINDLQPGTDYVFRIEAVSASGLRTSVDGIHVRTLTQPRNELPTNVTGFSAQQSGKKVVLNWQNPANLDFKSVRIVKSDKFFPADPADGDPVFEGQGEKFTDSNVEDGKTYYYAAFAKDAAGNYSSGAVTSIKVSFGGAVAISNPLDYLPQSPIVDPKIQSLTLGDFKFIQDGVVQALGDGGTISIDGAQNLKISIAYDKVPEILKTIAVTLTLPTDSTKQFTFLLRVNKDKTAYEAVLAPLGQAGTYGVKIAVVDYKNRGLKQLEGAMLATVAAADFAAAGVPIGHTESIALILEMLRLLTILILLYKSFFVIVRGLRKPKLAEAKARIKR